MSDSKGYTRYDSIYMISGKDKSYSDGKQIVTEPPLKIQFVCPMH